MTISRKIRKSFFNDESKERVGLRGSPLSMKQSRPPRKVSKLICVRSVPQTDTGSQLEKSKANE